MSALTWAAISGGCFFAAVALFAITLCRIARQCDDQAHELLQQRHTGRDIDGALDEVGETAGAVIFTFPTRPDHDRGAA
jgi:hypothetical protein